MNVKSVLFGSLTDQWNSLIFQKLFSYVVYFMLLE